jgi:hypothetical protein
MMLVIFSRRRRFAFSISVQRSMTNKSHFVVTFKELLFLGFDQWILEAARLMIINERSSFVNLLLMESSVVSLPFFVEHTVKLWESSVHCCLIIYF